jgi:hypothetical protein
MEGDRRECRLREAIWEDRIGGYFVSGRVRREVFGPARPDLGLES